jgi:hypothetical protein
VEDKDDQHCQGCPHRDDDTPARDRMERVELQDTMGVVEAEGDVARGGGEEDKHRSEKHRGWVCTLMTAMMYLQAMDFDEGTKSSVVLSIVVIHVVLACCCCLLRHDLSSSLRDQMLHLHLQQQRHHRPYSVHRLWPWTHLNMKPPMLPPSLLLMLRNQEDRGFDFFLRRVLHPHCLDSSLVS